MPICLYVDGEILILNKSVQSQNILYYILISRNFWTVRDVLTQRKYTVCCSAYSKNGQDCRKFSWFHAAAVFRRLISLGCEGQSKYQIKSILIAKCSQEITLAHYMNASQTGTKSRQRGLMLSLPWSSTLMMSFGTPQALSLPTMTERMRNCQPKPKIGLDLLLQLVPCKSMGPGDIHPRVLKDLADIIVKLLSMGFSSV